MKKKEVFAWGMYDLANTIFSALFVTFFFPFYVKEFLGGTEFHIGLMFGLSLLVVSLAVPILGALSDMMKRRMPFIIFLTIACCICTTLTIFGPLYWALILGFLANTFYHAALSFYNALMERVKKEKAGTISGIGAAMGYLGSLIGLGVAYLVLGKWGWETIDGMHTVIITTAALFFSFSLFLFFGIKEKRQPYKINTKHLKASVKKTWSSVSLILKKKKALRGFMLCLFLYSNAINAVTLFLFLYARSEIGLTVRGFFPVYALFALCAVLGAIVFGKLTDLWGAKKILELNGWAWVGILILLLNTNTYLMFLIVGCIGGFAMGSVWTAARPKLLSLAPKNRLGEYFGFLELTDKVSGTIGPVVFGFLSTFVNYQAAIIVTAGFFILGVYVLKDVPNK